MNIVSLITQVICIFISIIHVELTFTHALYCMIHRRIMMDELGNQAIESIYSQLMIIVVNSTSSTCVIDFQNPIVIFISDPRITLN